jgi:hypothetical protein
MPGKASSTRKRDGDFGEPLTREVVQGERWDNRAGSAETNLSVVSVPLIKQASSTSALGIVLQADEHTSMV